MLTNKDVARILKDTAALIELTGGNEFRARAFSSAARTIERLDEPVSALVEADALRDVRGIGAGLAAQIAEIVEHGTLEFYEELLRSVPPGLTELLRVKGLGARKVRKIWQSLGITNVDELEESATIGRLADLDGFGEKTQENILKNLKLLKQYGSRRLYARARHDASTLLDGIRRIEGVVEADFAGEMRRQLEIVSMVDVVAGAVDVEAVHGRIVGRLSSHGATATEATPSPRSSVGESGSDRDSARSHRVEPLDTSASQRSDRPTLMHGKLPDGLPFAVHVVPAGSYGTALWRLTGSPEHVDAFEREFGAVGRHQDESALFDAAGIPFIEPELREHGGEIQAAAEGRLPELITTDDLRGVLHNHTTYSDGAHTLRQMTEAARSLGYSYFGVSDHSRSLTVANGLPIDRVERQQEEIRSLNAEMAREGDEPFHVFSGIESDVHTDGSLDYPDEVLAHFDFVVASIHSRFSMTSEEATRRLVRAIENPFTTILGHATGRLLLRREGYPIDYERVIDACAATGVAIEINANPWRLDMDWRWIRRATERGVFVAINPDAHSIDELRYVEWGVAAARKGWLTPDQCLNAKPLAEFSRWIEGRRQERVNVTQI